MTCLVTQKIQVVSTEVQPRKMVNEATTSTLGSSRVVGWLLSSGSWEGVGHCMEERGTDLLLLLGLSAALSASSLQALALLQEGLGDEDLLLGGNGAVGG